MEVVAPWCNRLLPALLLALMATLWLLPTSARSERLSLPGDAGMINVKTAYGAVGDGVTDDTVALQNAIAANQNGAHGAKTLYFPSGTYRVSNTLSWQRYLILQGEDRSNTIIKLAPNSSGFTSPATPKAVVAAGFGSAVNTGFFNGIYN